MQVDGDSRGGAALSVKEVSGKPIKFVGVGEKLDALEPFYPDRMAGRILGALSSWWPFSSTQVSRVSRGCQACSREPSDSIQAYF